MAQEQNTTPQGRPFGRYQIVEKIGSGAMGMVYRGYDERIGRPIAIKILRVDLDRDSPEHKEFMKRFFQEARASGSLMHPSIVTIFDMDEVEGTPFIAMELMKGQTLKAMLGKGALPSPKAAAKIIEQVGSGLDYAHERGIVHRDVKPANIMVCKGGLIKLMDFGVARIASNSITATGSILGSPSYMAPEQIMGQPVDGKADQFSLAVCSYEVLTNRKPFPGKTITSIMHQILHEEVHLPSSFRLPSLEEFPEELERVLAKGMAKKAEDRFSKAGEYAQAFGQALLSGGKRRVRGTPARAAEAEARAADEARALSTETESIDSTMARPLLGKEPPPPAPEPKAEEAAGATRLVRRPVIAAPEPPRARSPLEDSGATVIDLSLRVGPTPAPEPRRPGEEDRTVFESMKPLAVPEPAAFPSRPPAEPVPRPVEPAPPRPPVAAPIPSPVASPPIGPRPVADGGRSSPLVKVALAAGVVVLLAGIVVLVVWLVGSPSPPPGEGKSTPGATSSKPPPEAEGRLRVDTVPTGAEVYVNGKLRGLTPMPLTLGKGTHKLEFRKRGFRDFSKEITMPDQASGEPLVVNLEPAKGS